MCQMQLEREKEMYLLHGKLTGHKRKVAKSIDIAKQALAQGKNPILSFSGGKDSIVMLDIVYKAGFRGELVFFKYGICTDKETSSETVRLLKRYAEKYNLKLNTIECLGEFDCWEALGYLCLSPETTEEKRMFNLTNNDFRKKSIQFEKDNDIDLCFIGMRKDESKRRKAVLNTKGNIYTTKSKQSVTCCPIANLSNQDIWAYIFNHNLPYLSCYDYEYGDRETIRNEPTLLYGGVNMTHTNLLAYKKMYPEYTEELLLKYPHATGML